MKYFHKSLINFVCMDDKDKLRIDKYLWAIRIFKTRSLETEACKAGRVKLNGQNIKASTEVKIGDVYQISKGIERKIIEVIALSIQRTDAKTAITKYKDLTPIVDNQHNIFQAVNLKRDKGTGRPTKKERRETDELLDSWIDD